MTQPSDARAGRDISPGASQAESLSAQKLARVVFAALVLASFAAFAITQRLKHTPTIVQHFQRNPYFSPTPAGHIKQEQISLRIANNDRVTVTILNSAGADVATLVRNLPLPRYKQLSLRWNGRQGYGYSAPVPHDGGVLVVSGTHGPPAPAGEYQVRVELLKEKHSLNLPQTFTLVRHEHGGRAQ